MSRLVNRRFKATHLISPADHTTSTDGNNTAIDTLGFEEMLLLVQHGVFDDVTLNIDIQQSDEAAANFATIAAPVQSDINPRLLQFVNADDNKSSVAYFDLSALKRYIKPVDTLNANSALYGVTALLFGPEDSSLASSVESDAT